MKKRYKIGISVLAVVLVVIIFMPVVKTIKTEYRDLGPAPTDEEGLKLRARQVYLLDKVTTAFPEATLKDIDEITIDEYYGFYNGCIVLSFNRGKYEIEYTEREYIVNVGGAPFWEVDYNRIRVFKNDTFYDFRTAYQLELLTYNEMQKIYAKYEDLHNIE